MLSYKIGSMSMTESIHHMSDMKWIGLHTDDCIKEGTHNQNGCFAYDVLDQCTATGFFNSACEDFTPVDQAKVSSLLANGNMIIILMLLLLLLT